MSIREVLCHSEPTRLVGETSEVTPAHNDDTQSGAPAGQVVTLVTGGLGTADAWKGTRHLDR